MSDRRALDLGCGQEKLADAVGMDVNPRSAADVLHDLDVFPWPFADGSFDYVRAQDVLEHVSDFFGVMQEVFRVCSDGATVEVRMPFMSSLNFATDPSHRRAGTARTFDYFDPGKILGRYCYSPARFTVTEFHYGREYHGRIGRLMWRLDRRLVPYCERHALVYEHYFAYLYPMQSITYRLRVDKGGSVPDAGAPV